MVAIPLLAMARPAVSSGDEPMIILFGAILLILLIAAIVAILRWALRINDIVRCQQQTLRELKTIRQAVAGAEDGWKRAVANPT